METISEKILFDSIISLGCNCNVASSLSKYGFRDHSGPFDWYISDFEGVLKTLDEDFEHFFEKKNLQAEVDRKEFFDDIKYGFNFCHEIDDNRRLGNDYNKIRNKYKKRINYYMSHAIYPMCYVRAIKSEDEIEYITHHVNFINQVIKKHNEKSIIIFIAPKIIDIPSNFPFPVYRLSICDYIGGIRSGLREIFDGTPEIIRFFGSHYNNNEKRERNIVIDQEREKQYYENISIDTIENGALEIIHRMQRESLNSFKLLKSAQRMPDIRVRNTMLVAMCDFSKIKMPKSIDIYGASWIGQFFYDKVRGFTHVDCFIDRKPPEINPQYHGTKIISIEKYENKNGNIIVVVPIYDYYEIVENLKKQLNNDKIVCVRIDDFLKEGVSAEKIRKLGL